MDDLRRYSYFRKPPYGPNSSTFFGEFSWIVHCHVWSADGKTVAYLWFFQAQFEPCRLNHVGFNSIQRATVVFFFANVQSGYIHTYMPACMHACMHASMHAHIQIYILSWYWLSVGDEVAVTGHSDTKRSDLWTSLSWGSWHSGWGSIVLNNEI